VNAVSVDVNMPEHLPAKTMLKLVEQAQKVKRWSALFQESVKKRLSLFRRLEELDIDVTFSMTDGDVNINFTGDGDRLGAVWGELRKAGWEPVSRPEKGKSTFYTHWHQDDLCSFWMQFSSSVCRRVKVGSKMVEQDIYEIQCGELPTLDAPKADLVAVEDANDIPF